MATRKRTDSHDAIFWSLLGNNSECIHSKLPKAHLLEKFEPQEFRYSPTGEAYDESPSFIVLATR